MHLENQDPLTPTADFRRLKNVEFFRVEKQKKPGKTTTRG